MKLDTSENASPVRTWVFQANPNYYGLAAALRRLRIIRWQVVQFREEIHEGHIVYLWLSGPKGGLLACGTAISEPMLLSDFEEEEEDDSEFVLVEEDHDPEKLWGDIRIDVVYEKPLTRQDCLKDRTLKTMDIIKRPFAGTNFRVSAQQAAALKLAGY